MAPRKKVYTQQAVTTTITADVKMTIKIGDNYYSVNTREERSVPETADVEREWDFLYESVYNKCGSEILNIQEIFEKPRGRKK